MVPRSEAWCTLQELAFLERRVSLFTPIAEEIYSGKFGGMCGFSQSGNMEVAEDEERRESLCALC